MSSQTTYDSIKRTVQSVLPGSRVLLFGSRARGDQDKLSDYDLLIITPETFTPQEKIYWNSLLDKAIVRHVRVPVDILLNSEKEISEKMDLPGNIIISAMREGIYL